VLFYVIDRFSGGVVSKYVYDKPFFAFHQINSYEEANGDIIIDLPRMDDLSFINNAHVENLRANLGPKSANDSSWADLEGEFTRFRLPHHAPSNATHAVEVDFVLPYDEANIELPRINDAYMAQAYRYTWGIHTAQRGNFADSIIRIDTETRDIKVWKPETAHLPSEPIFVARPEAVAEDDGVLLLVAMDAEKRVSSLVVLDAATMEEIGRAQLPVIMGYGFHGVWAGY
jgi:torulene dioxygenase